MPILKQKESQYDICGRGHRSIRTQNQPPRSESRETFMNRLRIPTDGAHPGTLVTNIYRSLATVNPGRLPIYQKSLAGEQNSFLSNATCTDALLPITVGSMTKVPAGHKRRLHQISSRPSNPSILAIGPRPTICRSSNTNGHLVVRRSHLLETKCRGRAVYSQTIGGGRDGQAVSKPNHRSR